MVELPPISRHLAQYSPDALVVVDSRGIVVHANASTRLLFGYAPEELIGQSMEVLVPERYRIRHGAHLAAYFRDPTNREMGIRMADLFGRRADGSEFSAGIRLAPFQESGATLVVAAIRDMTEHRVLREALVAAREQADRANHAKTRFLATASHDLRQPLQTIRLLNASMLALTEENSQLHDLLRRQDLAIDGAGRLLNALLDITKLESGTIEPLLAPVRLRDVFSILAGEFEPLARAKNVLLEFADTSVVINTDRVLFMQLLQNLIGNALKYTEIGSVKIALFSEADALAIGVEDSGLGIPPDKLERIFDDYYQVDQQGVQRSGVGLGLAIVREVSRLLGYSVTVSSQLGAGTRVRVRIPPQRVCSAIQAPADRAVRRAAHHTAQGEPRPASRGRVLLLEDNDSVRAATELFLTLEGYETHAAGSVAEAEALLANLKPGDLFISDYHLNGALTGLDVLQQLRVKYRRDVPAIVLSGDLQSMMRMVKTSIPHCRFLSKPVDTQALLAAIAELSDIAHRSADAQSGG